ncbi:hypothetical protein [Candidatus Mycoplasma haematohominis]|uniref:hypothetical protein n=1 Tax=Candidatus Mycoplasma haematohominis TaxID=1494318 RepID=UPI001C0A6CB9|nr:hypothetical protein [Candidatus Mycoplasma haemohominis]
MLRQKTKLASLLNFLGITTLTAGSVGGGIKIYLREFASKLDANSSLPVFQLIKIDDLEEIIPKVATFKSAIEDKGYKVIDNSSEHRQSKLSLLHKLDPHLTSLHYKANDLFPGSSDLVLTSHEIAKGKTVSESGQSLDFVINGIQSPENTASTKHKHDCATALEKPYDESKKDQLDKLIEWCTVIQTNSDLLTRNGFTLLDTDSDKDNDDWKKVISGGWLTKGFKSDSYNYWEKQSFFSASDLEQLIGKSSNIKEIKQVSDVEDKHIALFKERCKVELQKTPEIKNFPLSTYFLQGATSPNKSTLSVDSFFEATYFCTKPITAEEYLKNNLKAKTHVQSADRGLVCSLDELNNYEWYTYQPAQGKGFWCGVKAMYGGKE